MSPLTFWGVPSSESGKYRGKRSRAAVLGLPSALGALGGGGQGDGPTAIRRAYAEPVLAGSLDLTGHLLPSGVVDVGDFVVEDRNLDAYLAAATRFVTNVAENTDLVVALGGDDSVSYAVALGLSYEYDGLVVEHYDAHSDRYGTIEDPLDHGNWVAHTEVESIRIVQKGCRSITTGAKPDTTPLAEVTDEDTPVLIVVDLDVLDPAFAPGVACPVPCGWTTQDLLVHVLGTVTRHNVVGLAITELAPISDFRSQTADFASALITYVLAAQQSLR